LYHAATISVPRVASIAYLAKLYAYMLSTWVINQKCHNLHKYILTCILLMRVPLRSALAEMDGATDMLRTAIQRFPGAAFELMRRAGGSEGNGGE
jgi:hypothetical protein